MAETEVREIELTGSKIIDDLLTGARESGMIVKITEKVDEHGRTWAARFRIPVWGRPGSWLHQCQEYDHLTVLWTRANIKGHRPRLLSAYRWELTSHKKLKRDKDMRRELRSMRREAEKATARLALRKGGERWRLETRNHRNETLTVHTVTLAEAERLIAVATEVTAVLAEEIRFIRWGVDAKDAVRSVLVPDGMLCGPHRIRNTGDTIQGGTAYAFRCVLCGTLATLAEFEGGKVKCTPDAEGRHSREVADRLLNDITFKGATNYEITGPDQFGNLKTRILLRGEARESLALWLRARGAHTWGSGELRVRCFQVDHMIRPVVTVGNVIRTGVDSVELSREPWRGGQICGHQTTYGMGSYSERYCGARKAPGLVECREHYDATLADYGAGAVRQAVASGVAVGDPSAPLTLLWEPREGEEPEKPTEEERAAYAAAMGATASAPTCDRCGREVRPWPLERGDRCAPQGWVYCIRRA